MENSLSIIGAGRVGRALGRRLRELGWKIGAVITRSEASARRAVRFIGAGKPHARMKPQNVSSGGILIAGPDDEIAGEGAGGAVRAGRQIGGSLGGWPVQIPSGKKILYHAAATMAASNVLAMEEAAAQLLISVGMKRGQATRALLTLTRQVLENMEQLGPRAAWAGPTSGGDFTVVGEHLDAFCGRPT